MLGIFGGVSDDGRRSDTLRLNTTWETIPYGIRPTARAGHAHADLDNGNTLMFGGVDAAGTVLGDAWRWDGAQWSSVPVAGGPAARHRHAIASVSDQGEVVFLHGGTNGATVLSDFWKYDAGVWTQLPDGPAVYAHAMAWDAARDQLVLFGGSSGAALSDQLWVWDGSTWSAPNLISLRPSARAGAAMAWDEAHQVTLLFGGRDGVAQSDVWAWTGAAWQQPAVFAGGVSGLPSARFDHSAVYNSRRSALVVFGGLGPDGSWQDTWELDRNWLWFPVSAEVRPPARELAAVTFDTARGRVVLHGGRSHQLWADTWEYFAWANDCQANSECDTGFCVDGVCCDTACGGGVLTDCLACSTSAQSTGVDGTCAPVGLGAACVGDDNPCTTDTCTDDGVCLPADNTLGCDDGEYCNGVDTCIEGACASHAGNPCIASQGTYCIEASNACGECAAVNQADAEYCPPSLPLL